MAHRKLFLERAENWLTSPRITRFLFNPLIWFLGLRPKSHQIDLSQVERVLVIRVENGIGDMVLMTPFLRELRRNLPNAWITLTVESQTYNLVEPCPYVNEVIVWDWKESGRYPKLWRHGRALRFAQKHFWKRRFDLAILPRWDFDRWHGAFLAYFSGSPWRVSYSQNVNLNKSRANAGFDRLFTHLLYDKRPKHEVEHNLDVIRFLGGNVVEEQLEMWLMPEDKAFAEAVMTSHKIHPDKTLIAFCLGAVEPRRRWPLGNFHELGVWLKSKFDARIIVLGGREDEQLCQELKQRLGDSVINIAGRTTLRQTAGLLRYCHLYIGNDTGPMHLAAMAGVPVIEVSCYPRSGRAVHPNSPGRFGPWGVPSDVLQPEVALGSCTQACIAEQAHCILDIDVARVKEAVVRHLYV